MGQETRVVVNTRQYTLQREVNRYKVDIDYDVFKKSVDEKDKLKRLKKQYKNNSHEVYRFK